MPVLLSRTFQYRSICEVPGKVLSCLRLWEAWAMRGEQTEVGGMELAWLLPELRAKF